MTPMLIVLRKLNSSVDIILEIVSDFKDLLWGNIQKFKVTKTNTAKFPSKIYFKDLGSWNYFIFIRCIVPLPFWFIFFYCFLNIWEPHIYGVHCSLMLYRCHTSGFFKVLYLLLFSKPSLSKTSSIEVLEDIS